jgi:hypothetical protein
MAQADWPSKMQNRVEAFLEWHTQEVEYLTAVERIYALIDDAYEAGRDDREAEYEFDKPWMRVDDA